MKVHIDKIVVGEHEISVNILMDDRMAGMTTMMRILEALEPSTGEEDDLTGQSDLEEYTAKRGPGRPRKGA